MPHGHQTGIPLGSDVTHLTIHLNRRIVTNLLASARSIILLTVSSSFFTVSTKKKYETNKSLLIKIL